MNEREIDLDVYLELKPNGRVSKHSADISWERDMSLLKAESCLKRLAGKIRRPPSTSKKIGHCQTTYLQRNAIYRIDEIR